MREGFIIISEDLDDATDNIEYLMLWKVSPISIRKYRSEDCKEIIGLFYDTVHTVNAKDYSKKQLNVWATGRENCNKWNDSFLAHDTLVAIWNEKIVGFGDIDNTGYLDRLFVHKDYQGKGIATALCDRLEQLVEGNITTHASITARPFFERRGYKTLKEQKVERAGGYLTNFVMEKKR